MILYIALLFLKFKTLFMWTPFKKKVEDKYLALLDIFLTFSPDF